MAIRAQVGRPEGVTKPSITPETSSTTTSPSATPPADAPLGGERLAAGPVARRDPRPEQPQADPGGDEDGRQLEQAVRQDQAEEQLAAVVADHDRADQREVEQVLQQHAEHRQPQHPEGDAERGHPGVVGPHLGGEVRGRRLGVVALEVVVDQLVDLAGVEQRLLDLGVLQQPPHHHAPSTA